MNDKEARHALSLATTFANTEACHGAIYLMLVDHKGCGRLMLLQRALAYGNLLNHICRALRCSIDTDTLRNEVAKLLTEAAKL